MAAFVLVHGAWRGSWLWQRVRPRLQARGHDVFTPTLTGLADRSHLASPAVNLETHIADVINLVRWEGIDDFVLCGHSYAGCVVTGVADRIPERVRALVYLDAFVPESGQSFYDAVPAALRDRQLQAARERGDGWLLPPNPAALFDGNVADRDWVDAQCTPHPIATLQQALTLQHTIPPGKVTHVLATGMKDSPIVPFHALAKSKGWKTVEIPCGHDAMLDRPDEVVAILLDANRQPAPPHR